LIQTYLLARSIGYLGHPVKENIPGTTFPAQSSR
jgi:hypothetical protein